MEAALPRDEIKRLKALVDLNILDTEEEAVYDSVTAVAGHIMDTPISLISLIDNDRQWFKSKRGLAVKETPRASAFCAHAILDPFNSLIVNDATKDKRFSDNPLVIGDPQIRFYFGTPLVTADSQAIGTICAIDNKARPNPTPGQIDALQNLSRLVMSHLEMRRFIMDISDEISNLDRAGISKESSVYQDLNTKCDAILERIKLRKAARQQN